MADEIKTSIRQESYSLGGEGEVGQMRLNRRGELVTIDQYQQWVFDGRVYLLSNIARETPAAMGTASATFSDTDPALLVDVPNGTTMVPLEIILNTAGTVGGGVIRVLITVDNKVRYTSGGVAIPKQNMRFDEPRSSACPAYEGTTDIVAAGAGDNITLHGAYIEDDVATTPYGTSTRMHWFARESIAPVLVGPASLVIYAYAGSTQPSFFFVIKYAEFATTEVISLTS